jgi:hypothetical protein
MRMRLFTLAACVLAVSGVMASRAAAAPACDLVLVARAGAAIAAACPCEGKINPAGEVTPWKNHGGYVSCVTRERNHQAKALGLSKSCVRQATRCAARSTCGKRAGFVVCRQLDVCSDTLPGDDVAAGVCADDPTVACDTAAECPVLSCSVKSAAEICTELGGAAGTGSCCD